MNDRIDPRASFAPDISAFAQPVGGEFAPGGPSLRYAPEYLQIRQAREADDPNLPRGEWDRPLKAANWVLVDSLCTRVLLEQSKDFQVAFWLAEAWLHRFGTAGLRTGIAVVNLLVQEFWPDAHPLMEDGDVDARVAPFAWASEALALTLRVQLPLVALPDHDPAVGNLDLWERTLGGIPGEPKPGDKKKPVVVNPDALPKAGRADMLAHGDPDALQRLAAMADDLTLLTADWRRLDHMLGERLGREAPSLSRLTDTLDSLSRAVAALLEGRDPRSVVAPVPHLEPFPVLPESFPLIGETDPMPAVTPEPIAAPAVPVVPVAPPPAGGVIASRDDAYRMLEMAAAYLERTEPHSPTPYLVKRAVAWGRMSLSDLMQEILREEGDLVRYFSLLGIQTRAD